MGVTVSVGVGLSVGVGVSVAVAAVLVTVGVGVRVGVTVIVGVAVGVPKQRGPSLASSPNCPPKRPSAVKHPLGVWVVVGVDVAVAVANAVGVIVIVAVPCGVVVGTTKPVCGIDRTIAHLTLNPTVAVSGRPTGIASIDNSAFPEIFTAVVKLLQPAFPPLIVQVSAVFVIFSRSVKIHALGSATDKPPTAHTKLCATTDAPAS